MLHRWMKLAQEKIAFQGLPARICWLGYGERHRAGLLFNELVASGRVKAPIVIGRDHLDAGSVASPNRETEGMLDGTDAALGKNDSLPPCFAAIGGQQQKRILGKRGERLAAGPTQFGIQKLDMVQRGAAYAFVGLAPGVPGILARQQHGVERYVQGVNVAGRENPAGPGGHGRLDGGQFQIDGARLIRRATQAGPLDIVFGAAERQHHRLAGILQHGWRGVGGRLLLSPGRSRGQRRQQNCSE